MHQVRLCIEVLRSYLAGLPANPPLAAALAVQEARYRQAAYFALLNHLGTSFDEVRTSSAAPQEQRKALADRLGITLGPSRPDNLDALFLDPSAAATQPKALTEQKLESLFGLVNTTRDPLQPDLTAAFLGWQLDYLLQEWRARDFPLEPIPDALPIIDPDLLIKGDFKSAILSDPAFALFKTRQDNVQAWAVELDNKRAGTATSLIKFNAMLAAVMPISAPSSASAASNTCISTIPDHSATSLAGPTITVRGVRLLGSGFAGLSSSKITPSPPEGDCSSAVHPSG